MEASGKRFRHHLRRFKNAWSGWFGDSGSSSGGGKNETAPQAQVASEILKKPLKSEQKISNSTTNHNNVTIHVKTQPHQDTKAIADEVMQRFQSQRDDALYDVATS